uniref:(California timema) hypothetical protein n=1 Tax=Timema californicum TaxID=61474 RepID=A0A7R9J6Q4_TIMCA|nr:unnamed protein product [Timema californicum]
MLAEPLQHNLLQICVLCTLQIFGLYIVAFLLHSIHNFFFHFENLNLHYLLFIHFWMISYFFMIVKPITNEDRIRLYHNLVNSRRTLVDTDMLKKPQDTGGGFLRNTLRRLSKHRLEKLRQEHGSLTDHGETYKGFPYAYWAFSRSMIPQSLHKIPEVEEQVALQVFQIILTYAGLGQNGDTVRSMEEEHVNLIQSVMERCMRKDVLLTELYLQLIKQTTDHPDPNSRVNLRHWALLSLAVSVILPPNKAVRKYLLTHLKRCASDYVTEEGKYARFAEKCMSKTQGTRRRQWPPSREEIMCTINRRPIYARFHFMDGQYHAVEFHPSATAKDVMEIVKKKIGLRETALGYAIYEVLGNSERSLVPEEKVADVMSKWERYRMANVAGVNCPATANGNSTSVVVGKTCRRQHHFFLFKKHLFLDDYMDLSDPVEKELLYHQVLHGLRSDRFPISEKEAVSVRVSQYNTLVGVAVVVVVVVLVDTSSVLFHSVFPVAITAHTSTKSCDPLLTPPRCSPPNDKRECMRQIASWTAQGLSPVMLTALQAQLEMGDCGDVLEDYRSIASHCLPPRFVPNIPHEGVALHHQSLRGMTSAEAKKAFLNLIQSWPLHKATIFDVMQSFTSNWPRVLWLAVDQDGLHLLEHRSRNALCSYEYDSILSYSPALNCLMIITGSEKKQSKVILTTSQAFQIANLIREYTEVLQSPKQIRHNRDVNPKKKIISQSRPVSILHKPVPIIDGTPS